MAKPLVSIITVSFNAAKTIEETIQSVFSQDFKDVEYIIKDGGSKDATIKIVSKYKNKIDLIISSPDTGLYDAMNIAVKKARGEYVYFLNADDVFAGKKVLSQVAPHLDGNNDFVYGDIDFFYPDEKRTVTISRTASLSELKKGSMPPHQGTFVKRKLLLENPFNTRYRSSGDFDFFCRIMKKGAQGKKVNTRIARMTMGGVSAGAVSYRETEEAMRAHFGLLPYVHIVVTHRAFSLAKAVLRTLGIRVHKG